MIALSIHDDVNIVHRNRIDGGGQMKTGQGKIPGVPDAKSKSLACQAETGADILAIAAVKARRCKSERISIELGGSRRRHHPGIGGFQSARIGGGAALHRQRRSHLADRHRGGEREDGQITAAEDC